MFRTLLISLFLTSTALATTWTVDDDGKADFDNIQAAVDAASDGDEIIVMPGTYTSTQDGHVVNMLGKAVTLRSSDPSDPDVVAATIIDAEGTRRGLACFNGETSKTIISGFTITNGGIYGSMLSTPILNPPQSAVLGMHNIIERPVVINKSVVVRPIMYLALSYDHRIVDGKEAVSFLKIVKECLEDPRILFLNL